MILCKQDGTIVTKGVTLTDFRGEQHIVTGWKEPHKNGASGYIYLDSGSQLYVTVFNLHWESSEEDR